nr:hypothetical protein Iba_chr11fCG3790 [Ipomoea batatas]
MTIVKNLKFKTVTVKQITSKAGMIFEIHENFRAIRDSKIGRVSRFPRRNWTILVKIARRKLTRCGIGFRRRRRNRETEDNRWMGVEEVVGDGCIYTGGSREWVTGP